MCIAVIKRENDDDDKLIVVPKDTFLTNEEIRILTDFQEQFFKSTIMTKAGLKAVEYQNTLLVDLYDTINPYATDTKFYVELIESFKVKSVLDLGCGTGILAAELIKKSIRIIGVDPSKDMLKVAKVRVPEGPSTWIEGTIKDVQQTTVDAVVMTGHVAQVFLEDADWKETLFAIYKALIPGGYLVFESRNPEQRSWASWNKEKSVRTIEHQKYGEIEMWHQLTEEDGTVISYDTHYKILSSGNEVVSHNKLIFRSIGEIEASLKNVGFEIEHIYGDWNKTPVAQNSKELIFIAKKD